MKCLLCNKEKLDSNILDIFSDDEICHKCRKEWGKKEIKFIYEGIKLRSTYLYNDAFRKALIQYKECYDEALKNIFLYGLKDKLRLIYHGYTLVLMPSSISKQQKRGFSHLKEIFACLNMDMIEPFIKIDDIDQKSLNMSERKNIIKKIKLKEGIIIPPKILLVDDVITSGATLSTAINLLHNKTEKMEIYTISYASSYKDNKAIFKVLP